MSEAKARAEFERISIKTADNLKLTAMTVQDLSMLSLPQIEEMTELVGRVLPAGNIPSLIVSGLARLPGRKAPRDVIQRDIDILFNGINQTLEKAVYSAFFAGPAAVIWGYQNLVKLAGKDADDAFPDGTWQFYVDYALREDTARHANETHGFQSTLDKYDIELNQTQRIAALVMAAMRILQEYDALLENEWRERVYTTILVELTAGTTLENEAARVYRNWEKQRPYARERDAKSNETYAMYRKRKFDDYIETVLETLPSQVQAQWVADIRHAKQVDLPEYIRQMDIYGYLFPEEHYETHVPVTLDKLHIGVILEGQYYLIPITKAHSQQAHDIASVYSIVDGILRRHQPSKNQLQDIARLQRAKHPVVFERLDTPLVNTLNQLRYAPILINCDRVISDQPLSQLRQAERGIGNHALTIFDTDKTLVFDQSHIYFDGAWGAALAEIFTSEAQSWAIYFNQTGGLQADVSVPASLDIRLSDNDHRMIQSFPGVTSEVGVEHKGGNLRQLLALRRMFKQRSDLLQATVNDLLVLYRAIHAVSYEPSDSLLKTLDKLDGTNAEPAARLARRALQDRSNPAILIPVDASTGSPRDRLYPMSFEVPLADLKLIKTHQQVLLALYRYEKDGGKDAFEAFYAEQGAYLAVLSAFGAVLSRAKEIAIRGESAAVSTIKLLAHMPTALQRLLDDIPGRFDVLNDIIKGREVFSNVGMVAPTSTLTRFITAKDDNDKKTLAWGVMTDANGVMTVSLRDFRPHVGALQSAGFEVIAQQIAQDYLDAYVQGFNSYITDLHRITRASRNTRMNRGDS